MHQMRSFNWWSRPVTYISFKEGGDSYTGNLVPGLRKAWILRERESITPQSLCVANYFPSLIVEPGSNSAQAHDALWL